MQAAWFLQIFLELIQVSGEIGWTRRGIEAGVVVAPKRCAPQRSHKESIHYVQEPRLPGGRHDTYKGTDQHETGDQLRSCGSGIDTGASGPRCANDERCTSIE